MDWSVLLSVADWVVRLFWAGVTATLAAVSLIVAGASYWVARSAHNLSKATTRPWLMFLGRITFTTTLAPSLLFLKVVFELKNSGNVPAHMTECRASFFPSTVSVPHRDEASSLFAQNLLVAGTVVCPPNEPFTATIDPPRTELQEVLQGMCKTGGRIRVSLKYKALGQQYETIQAYELDGRWLMQVGDFSVRGKVLDPQHFV